MSLQAAVAEDTVYYWLLMFLLSAPVLLWLMVLGCGNPDHILEVLRDMNASTALAASIFHFGEYTVADVKECLEGGVHVRL